MSNIHRWRRESVEQRLLSVAEHLIMTRGIGQVSLALVARAAGVSRATAYNYFGDQRGLLSKFVAYRFQQLESVLDPLLARKGLGPREQLAALIRESVDFFERYSRFFRILVRERADLIVGGPHDGLTAATSEGMARYMARLTAPLKTGMRRGLFVGEDPERMAWAVAGMITHAVLRILEHPSATTRAKELGIMEAIIFHAVLEEPSPTLRRHLQILSDQRTRAKPQVLREVAVDRWQRIKSVMVMATFSAGVLGCAAPRHAQLDAPDLQGRMTTLERRVEAVEARQQTLEDAPRDETSLRGQVERAPREALPASETPAATEIQLALKRAGCYDGPIDGKVGGKTTKAIKAFQRSRGLTVDGTVGPKTWAALSRYLAPSGGSRRSR